MNKKPVGIPTRHYCNACGYLARQYESSIPLDLYSPCPRCGEKQFEFKGVISREYQLGWSGSNSC